MAKRDYYEVLGVRKDASADQIKSAYRKLLLNIIQIKTKVIKLLKINLKKHQKLITYYLTQRENKTTTILDMQLLKNGGGGRGGFGNFDFSSSFSDIFEDFFGEGFGGGRRTRRSNNRGSDLRYDLSISLEEAFSGKKQDIKFST